MIYKQEPPDLSPGQNATLDDPEKFLKGSLPQESQSMLMPGNVLCQLLPHVRNPTVFVLRCGPLLKKVWKNRQMATVEGVASV